jgi:hypothetical protein
MATKINPTGKVLANQTGAWNSGTAYAINDVCQSGGSSYIATAAGTNHVPPDAGYWAVYVSKGDGGDQGDQGDQGNQGNQGNEGDQGNQGDTGDQGDQGNQGNQGDQGDQGNQGNQGVSGVLAENTVSGTTQALAVNQGYYLTNSALVTCTLPATAASGAVIEIEADNDCTAGFKVAQNASQTIEGLGGITTAGTGGYATFIAGSSIRLKCTVADTAWELQVFNGEASFN